MRGKIVRTEPYSPNVEKVFYADGSWGLRSNRQVDDFETVAEPQIAEPDFTDQQGVVPATPEELDEMEKMLQGMKPKSRGTTEQTIPLPDKKGT